MKLALTFFVLGALLQIAACAQHPMSNDDIIRETKKCHDAGMRIKPLTDEFGVTRAVQCEPKESP